ncbi:MAG: LON peptidase substrate-binding domain-containing protein [Leptospirales bacterium]|nr:LON peptidase substrate-binding domain-containing protein [Leptospirales bacterium]
MNHEIAKIFFLHKKVLFPHCTINMHLKNSSISNDLKKGDRILAFPIKNIFDILLIKFRVATLAEIIEIGNDNEKIILHLKGITRARIKKFKGIHEALFEINSSKIDTSDQELVNELRKKTQELVFLINVPESDRLIELMNFLVEVNKLTDFIANYFILDYKLKKNLLNTIDVKNRSSKLLKKLNQLIKKME